MKRLLIFAIILLTLPAFAVTTYYAYENGVLEHDPADAHTTNWNTAADGSGTDGTPGEGDTCILNNKTGLTGQTTFPSSGTLASFNDTTGAGCVTYALNTLGNCAINATAISSNTATTGLINVTGSTTNTLTIVVANFTTAAGLKLGVYFNSTGKLVFIGTGAGTPSSSAYIITNVTTGSVTVTGSMAGPGILNSSIGPCVITGNLIGTVGVGFYNAAAAAVTVNGNGSSATITGGTNASGFGFRNQTTGVVTLNNCNLVNSVQCVAFSGYPPVWNNASNLNTITCANTGSGSNVWVTALFDHEMMSGTVRGATTGNVVAATAASVLSTHSYGPSDDQTTGTYHVATPAEILSTVNYGAGSVEVGTWVAAANADVEAGVANGVDPSVGTFVVPLEVDVEDGVKYGNAEEFEGSFAGGGVIVVED